MSLRAARLWQLGNPQRKVDPRMSKHDVREYLTKIYDLPVRDVRIENKMGEIRYNTKIDARNRRALWKEDDKKFAYVFLPKSHAFNFPPVFRSDEVLESIQKYKDQQEQLSRNSQYVNRDRFKIGEFFGI